jgi:hypothetical protein
MPTSLISSLKSFAAVYRPHMPQKYYPRTLPVQPKIVSVFFRDQGLGGQTVIFPLTLRVAENHRLPAAIPA